MESIIKLSEESKPGARNSYHYHALEHANSIRLRHILPDSLDNDLILEVFPAILDGGSNSTE